MEPLVRYQDVFAVLNFGTYSNIHHIRWTNPRSYSSSASASTSPAPFRRSPKLKWYLSIKGIVDGSMTIFELGFPWRLISSGSVRSGFSRYCPASLTKVEAEDLSKTTIRCWKEATIHSQTFVPEQSHSHPPLLRPKIIQNRSHRNRHGRLCGVINNSRSCPFYIC